MMAGELGSFGDQRLARAGDALMCAVLAQQTLCLHRLSEDRAQVQRFGRFLANPAVSTGEMLSTTGRATGLRAAGRHVLAIMDTTDLSFPTQSEKKHGFGLDANGAHNGVFLHPVIAVDAESGGMIGLVDCTVLNRIDGKVGDHKKRPFEDKESQRWLAGAQIAGERLAEAAMITVVADRESDIYDLFANRPAGVHLLCRSAQARALAEGGLLPEHCETLPEAGRQTIEVPARPGQAARQAVVAFRFAAVTLRRPVRTGVNHLPQTLRLWVVDVREPDPPAGVAPVHWRLLTTHDVTTLAQAQQIVAWYRQRWIIEQVFRALKSHGLDLEASQMQDACHFTKLAVIGLIAAVRVMQLVLARDGDTAQPVTDAVDPNDMPALRQINAKVQGRTEKLRNPHDETTLAWFVWIVARLGGWFGYVSRGYRPPGPKTIHHGLIRLEQILFGWNLQNRSAFV